MDDRIVDACAMQLVMNPWQFDVIVTTNLFGDILSDEIAGLIGGLGHGAGRQYRREAAIFEAVHGSAPDIAGQGIANPLALFLAAALMLDHVEPQDLAHQLRAAVLRTLQRTASARAISAGRPQRKSSPGYHRSLTAPVA